MYSSVFLIEELGILTFWLFLNGVFSLSLKVASALLGKVQENMEVLLQCGERGGLKVGQRELRELCFSKYKAPLLPWCLF